jgi:hypothetical protein
MPPDIATSAGLKYLHRIILVFAHWPARETPARTGRDLVSPPPAAERSSSPAALKRSGIAVRRSALFGIGSASHRDNAAHTMLGE